MTDNASDMPTGSWVERAPPAVQPYLKLARLDRPIGTWLLLLPAWWSLALAANDWPDLYLFLLFGIGALVMRGAGCTLNDIADRNYDSKVARTATRPIASGQISVFQAFLFMGLQTGIGLIVLLQFNLFSLKVGAASLVIVAIYPFMKRFTYWPQLVLGFAFNWGALLGWAVVTETLSAAPGFLYAAGIFWTLGYDTIYAHQDKEDDIKVGVKSTALKFGDKTGSWITGFYILAISLLVISGWIAGLGNIYYALLIPPALHLIWQIRTVDINQPTNCLKRFKSNRDFGLLVLIAIIAGRALS